MVPKMVPKNGTKNDTQNGTTYHHKMKSAADNTPACRGCCNRAFRFGGIFGTIFGIIVGTIFGIIFGWIVGVIFGTAPLQKK